MIKFLKVNQAQSNFVRYGTLDIFEPIEATFTDGEGRIMSDASAGTPESTVLQISPTPTPAPSIEATV